MTAGVRTGSRSGVARTYCVGRGWRDAHASTGTTSANETLLNRIETSGWGW
jgi:hypothetical protein